MTRRGGARRDERAGRRVAGAVPSASVMPEEPVPTSTAVAQLVRRDDGVLLLLDGAESSYVDLRDPTHLDFEYQQQMDAALSALLGPTTPVRAVHLGAAGCGLARAWDATRPGTRQLAVELDALLARYVRAWFDLPRAPGLRIRVGDAAVEVASLRPGQWDVVVRDVFAAGVVPAPTRTEEFVRACATALTPNGVYLANVASIPREVAGAEIATAREVFASVLVVADPAVVRGRRRGNLVLVASARPWDREEREAVERAVRRLPLPVRTWDPGDRELPRP